MTASDSGGLSDSIDVTITVTNEDEMGEVTLWAGTDALTMAPQVGETIAGAVMDPDGGVTGETWQWSRTKTPDMVESWMPITGATAAAYMVTAGDTGYDLRVMATYTDAAGTDMAMVYSMPTMMVTMNASPEFADSEDGARSVAENTGAGMDIGASVTATDANGDTLAYTLVGTDAASFDIDPATGQLMTKVALDYETKGSYEVMVTASDSGGLSDSIDVTITVTNEDEMGRVTFWRDGADATTAAIMVGDMLSGLAEDPDGNVGDTPPITDMYPTINGATWQWAKTKTPDMMESWMPITGATDAAYTVMDADEGYRLRATAMYDDGEGMGKMASEQTMMVITAPEFADSEDGARSVAENTGAGMDIGAPVTATDANDDALDYTLGGTDAASFDIGSDTGQLMTLAALDYETKATYSVTVTASDSGGLSDSIDVTVTVTDVNEAPVITGDAALNYAENGTAAVATYSATDPESATITWSLEGDDAADFEISAGGELTFKSSPDHEAAADADTDNTYEVTVVASDGTNEDRWDVTITVTDVDEDVTPDDPLVDRYDENDNGEIERAEVFAAIDDYLDGDAGAPTRADVFKLIEFYLGD